MYIDVIEKFYNGLATQEELNAADWEANWAAYRAANKVAYWAARDNQISQLKKIIQEA